MVDNFLPSERENSARGAPRAIFIHGSGRPSFRALSGYEPLSAIVSGYAEIFYPYIKLRIMNIPIYFTVSSRQENFIRNIRENQSYYHAWKHYTSARHQIDHHFGQPR